ncbi:MAG: dienelactone hydrolase family protein [Planctomycetes bacterium]|nr:dienelactone hydrolase family protein [Planctomycetota bacterium]
MAIQSERLTLDVGGRTMAAYLAKPAPGPGGAGGPFPAVLVFMEIFGVNSHIRSIVDRLAGEGYVALAPDYFHRTAPGLESGYDQAGFAKGMPLIGQLRADEVLADARAAIDCLRGRADVRGDRLGGIGFCIGGHVAYLVATAGLLQATASFYGGGIAALGLGETAPTVARTPGTRGRIRLFFGGQDAYIPHAQVETIRKALADAGVRHEIFTYADANHGFFCDARASYHKPSHDDAWGKVKELFRDELAR